MSSYELWKPIPDYPDYLVSDAGNVRSLKHGKDISLGLSLNGRYLGVSLLLNGKQSPRRIHRLVMLAFAGPVPEGMEVLHINGVSTDNRLENLKYGTRKENNADILRHGHNYMSNKTHCIQGHLFDSSNTYILKYASGGVQRNCRTCGRIRNRTYMLKKGEVVK